MILTYILTGMLLSAVGVIPLGASNIAVITTTSKESLSKGLRIARGAGVGEVVLAFFALWYTKMLANFFEMNAWIQISFIGLFFIGVYIGTFITLYFYGKLSRKSAQKQRGEKYKLYRIIGIALILISTLQGLRFFIN